MPELPEVETTRRGIEPLIVNKTIAKALVHNPSLRWPVSQEITQVLPQQRILSVSRRSKYLLVHCDKGTIIIHLGMTGHLRCAASLSADKRKHDHVELLFTDGSVLRFNDSRRFGAVLWTDNENPLLHPLLMKLGPEPFSAQFTPEYLYKKSRSRKVAVKPFLMDAHVVVGVGNIYASEALFRARIAPKKAAGQVSQVAYRRLVKSVVDILNEAIAAGGTTIRDFADSEGKPGYFKQELCVYGREGQPCTVCENVIKQIRLGQRATYYCPKCQR